MSNRDVFIESAALIISIGLSVAALATNAMFVSASPMDERNAENAATSIVLGDGTQADDEDRSEGEAVSFGNGWALSAAAFEDQMFLRASSGNRCIAHDRTYRAGSTQTWNGNDLDSYAEDLVASIESPLHRQQGC